MTEAKDPTNNTSSDSKDVWYWTDTFPTLPESTITLFESYAHVPPHQLQHHVNAIKEKAWATFHYPCIGSYRFMEFSISSNPRYAEILSKLKAGAKYLDLGCCFGQDIRRLVADGAESSNLFGADIEKTFIELGYELFKDKETIKSTFFVGDMFDEEFLKDQQGKFDIIHMGSFLHLFPLDKQVFLVKRIGKLLSQKKGNMIAGRQVGNINPGHYQSATQDSMYQHNEQTFKDMWCQNVEGEWKMEASMKEWQGNPGRKERTEGLMIIVFTAERL